MRISRPILGHRNDWAQAQGPDGRDWNDFQEKDLANRLFKQAPSSPNKSVWKAPGHGAKPVI